MVSDFLELKMPNVSPCGTKILEMVSKEDFDILALSKAISQDPVLSSTVLKYANAPIYRRLVDVTNVRQAISILGLKNVRMAVVVATMRAFSEKPNPHINKIWEHSFAIATLCRLIAERVCSRLAEDVELTGLLHEMGSLILATNFPEKYEQVVNQSLEQGVDVEVVEKEVFGINHNDLLTGLINELRLPDITIYALGDLAVIDSVEMAGRDVDYHIAIIALAHYLYQLEAADQQHPIEHMPDNYETLLDKLELVGETIDVVLAQFREATSKSD